ncbi:hypothetical protein BJY00DRAFT_279237 [Aspergillus carlsbadensis]|nr:hypothetical protein BJY00DRAFT_279237 [Aspergillus carlsbadensis]
MHSRPTAALSFGFLAGPTTESVRYVGVGIGFRCVAVYLPGGAGIYTSQATQSPWKTWCTNTWQSSVVSNVVNTYEKDLKVKNYILKLLHLAMYKRLWRRA